MDAEKASYYFPITQRGRYTVDREVFERLAAAGLPAHPDGVCNRVKIADLPSMWPANALREKALEGGRIFLRDMAMHGLEPLTELEGLTVIGPYKHRRFFKAPNSLSGTDANRWLNTTARAGDGFKRLYGRTEDDDLPDEDHDPGAADFILEGMFIERRGRIIEYDDHKN